MDWRKYEHMGKKEENGQGGTPQIQKNETQVTPEERMVSAHWRSHENTLQLRETKDVERT